MAPGEGCRNLRQRRLRFPIWNFPRSTISKMVEERFIRSATSSQHLLAGVLTTSLKNRKWGEREDFLEITSADRIGAILPLLGKSIAPGFPPDSTFLGTAGQKRFASAIRSSHECSTRSLPGNSCNDVCRARRNGARHFTGFTTRSPSDSSRIKESEFLAATARTKPTSVKTQTHHHQFFQNKIHPPQRRRLRR